MKNLWIHLIYLSIISFLGYKYWSNATTLVAANQSFENVERVLQSDRKIVKSYSEQFFYEIRKSVEQYPNPSNMDMLKRAMNAFDISVKSEQKKGILDLHRWNFVNGGLKYSVSIPLPAKNRIMRIMTESNAFQLNYSNSNVQGIVDCIDDTNAHGDDSMRLEKKRTRYWKPFHIYRS